MADVMPNYHVEQHRLRTEILEQQTNISKQMLQIMEMQDRKARMLENITAGKRAVDKKAEQLKGLQKTHGTSGEEDVQKLIASI